MKLASAAAIPLLLTTGPVFPQVPTQVSPPMDEAKVTEMCAAESAKPAAAVSQRVIGVVTDEWQRYGAFERDGGKPALVNGEVRLPRLESSWDELKGASDYRTLSNAFVWARVENYWKATGGYESLNFAYQIRFKTNGVPAREGGRPDGEILRDSVNLVPALAMLKAAAADGKLDAKTLKAFELAATRASLIEQPWSAVFISSMMGIADFKEPDFTPATNHSAYMRSALEATYGQRPASYRYIACPPTAKVRVRQGDLICNARLGVSGGFSTLVYQPRFFSHCDIVVSASQNNGRFEILSIGGNVENTVSRTRYTGIGPPALSAIDNAKKAWIAVLLLR